MDAFVTIGVGLCVVVLIYAIRTFFLPYEGEGDDKSPLTIKLTDENLKVVADIIYRRIQKRAAKDRRKMEAGREREI